MMLIKLVNTKNINNKILFKNAILNPFQNGLWMFPHIPKFHKDYFEKLHAKNLKEISYDVCKAFNINEQIGENALIDIIDESFNFPIITKELQSNLDVCELYHGPSKSFKDFGTLFTANLIHHLKPKNEKINIISATTGDTGSAIATAFYNKENIDVHILYPKNKISLIQQKQMTTLGRNINCYEINGNFDDCQKLVKDILNKKNKKNNFTSCNSVNIGRIVGQLFYYFYICKNNLDKKINITIPTGNMGNGLSCYIAKEMGLPINDIILACNENSNLSKLLNYDTTNLNINSKKTYSNAIDIINPSNYERLNSYINNFKDTNNVKVKSIIPTKTNDNETIYMINYIYYNYGYLIDPHTAVCCDALFNKYNYNRYNLEEHNIILSTADPIKFYFEIDYENKIKLTNDINKLLDKKEYIKDIKEINKYLK